MLKSRTIIPSAIIFLLLLALSWESALPQEDYGSRLGQREGDKVAFRPQGPGTLLGTIDPVVKKWYLPQELYQEYQWQTWDYTNYGRDRYKRYNDPINEGDYFYDLYGNFITRGWLIYNWKEERPRSSEGSSILKTGQYGSFFSSLVIAADQKGQYSYSITVGDEIRTTLTPMTFRKSTFNGAQADFMSDNYSATVLLSRISAPGIPIAGAVSSVTNDYTNLIGGRAKVNIGDFVTVGGTIVNAHTGRGNLESFTGNPYKGALTTGQLQDKINTITIRLSDASPADNTGGAVLLSDDVEITTKIGERDTVLSGNAVGFRPNMEGGILKEGAIVADGTETIRLRYDLSDLVEIVGDIDVVNSIEKVRFRFTLANDYKVEMTSDRQTNREGQPIFVLVTQAKGNVKDASNKKEVGFDYGLPTANQVYGFTLEVKDLMGFNLYTEFDINHRFRQYPNLRLETHDASSGIVGDEASEAWMMNLSKISYPWRFFAEGFYMDDSYNTSPFMVDQFGRIDYEDETRSIYDFVDDNDDQDQKPDQERRFQDYRTSSERGTEGSTFDGAADDAVFPGWDENNDFISDFNQNSTPFRENTIPDYDEPFLRYGVDRPEFLFGMDLNNNGWIDRFENDNEPDYPYKKDRKGYNVYLGSHITPEMSLTVGQEREFLISDDRKNLTTYAFFTFEREYAKIGRLRFFDMVKKVKDNIQDDLFQWIQPAGSVGVNQFVPDPLSAQDTWINTAWFGFDRSTDWGINLVNKFKYDILDQRQDESITGFKENTRLLGIVNKVDYVHKIGNVRIRPKFKSALLKDNTPYSLDRAERDEWSGIFSLVFEFPALRKTNIEIGLEQLFSQDMLLDETLKVVDDEGNVIKGNFEVGEPTGDFFDTVLAAQLTNIGDYLGYRLITQLGIRVDRKSLERFEEDRKSQTDSFVFVTMYAGVQE